MRYLQTYLAPKFNYYLEALFEAFADINTYVDELIETEVGHNFLIALIIATPIAGTLIFYSLVMVML